MTSSTPPVSTATPSGSAGAGEQNGWNDGENGIFDGPGNLNKLYLFTFLATFVLLFSVSSAVLLRSYLHRRRIRRRRDAERTSGRVYTSRQQVGAKRRLVPKPRLYDSWLQFSDPRPKLKAWEDIMPVSVQLFKQRHQIASDIADGQVQPATCNEKRPSRKKRSHLATCEKLLFISPESYGPPSPPLSQNLKMVQATVLIEMPSQNPSPVPNDIPEIAIGTCRVPFRPRRSSKLPPLA